MKQLLANGVQGDSPHATHRPGARPGGAPGAVASTAARPQRPLETGTGAGLRRFVRFGPDRQFVGVLTGPDAATAPVLLLPNAGLQPRCGPYRLHVELGERLAASGLRSFRFDVPGVGEAPRATGFDAAAAAVAAMDALESGHGARRFVVGGICSAADVGWHAALRDGRVSGLLQLDGLAYRGPWYAYARQLDRLRRIPGEWRRMLRDARTRGAGGKDGLPTTSFRDWPTREAARQGFAHLVGRGVAMLWIYTGGYTDTVMHARQFHWSFGAAAAHPRVAMHFWPDCDHTFFSRTHRDRLVERVTRWMLDLGTASGDTP
jgi:hypothetical protein